MLLKSVVLLSLYARSEIEWKFCTSYVLCGPFLIHIVR